MSVLWSAKRWATSKKDEKFIDVLINNAGVHGHTATQAN